MLICGELFINYLKNK